MRKDYKDYCLNSNGNISQDMVNSYLNLLKKYEHDVHINQWVFTTIYCLVGFATIAYGMYKFYLIFPVVTKIVIGIILILFLFLYFLSYRYLLAEKE